MQKFVLCEISYLSLESICKKNYRSSAKKTKNHFITLILTVTIYIPLDNIKIHDIIKCHNNPVSCVHSDGEAKAASER